MWPEVELLCAARPEVIERHKNEHSISCRNLLFDVRTGVLWRTELKSLGWRVSERRHHGREKRRTIKLSGPYGATRELTKEVGSGRKGESSAKPWD